MFLKLAPILFHIIPAGAAFWNFSRRRSELNSIPFLLSFVALAGAIQGFGYIFCSPSSYFRLYWTAEYLFDILLLAVATELIFCLLPGKVAVWWSAFFLLLLGFVIGASMPLSTHIGYLWILIVADMTAGAILSIMVWFSGLKWDRELALITTGLVLVLLGNALPAVRWTRGLDGPVLFACVQLGPLAGLLVFWWASRK